MKCRISHISIRSGRGIGRENRRRTGGNLFGSWKRFGRKQPKTTLERLRPGDSVIVRMRGSVLLNISIWKQDKQGGTAYLTSHAVLFSIAWDFLSTIGSHNAPKNSGNNYGDNFCEDYEDYGDWEDMEKLEDWGEEDVDDAPLSFN